MAYSVGIQLVCYNRSDLLRACLWADVNIWPEPDSL